MYSPLNWKWDIVSFTYVLLWNRQELGIRKGMHYVCSYLHRIISPPISEVISILHISCVLDAAEGLSYFAVDQNILLLMPMESIPLFSLHQINRCTDCNIILCLSKLFTQPWPNACFKPQVQINQCYRDVVKRTEFAFDQGQRGYKEKMTLFSDSAWFIIISFSRGLNVFILTSV